MNTRAFKQALTLILIFFITIASVPYHEQRNTVVPGQNWETRQPDQVGMSATKLNELKSYVKGRGAVVRNGYMVYTWGDQALRTDIASAAKPFYSHFLFEAVEQGRLASLDVKINSYQRCVNKINGSLGYPDRNITFRQLANQTAAYGVTEHPGEAFNYDDYQMALFWDTLFLKVFGTTYANVDQEVFRPQLTNLIGMQDQPTMMSFGTTKKQGRIAISLRDHARFGWLYLQKGQWGSRQVINGSYVDLVTSGALSNRIPRTRGEAAQMCSRQRSIGETAKPNNQTDHLGSYSYLWWTNGVDRNGKKHWPDAPADTFVARGLGSRYVLVVIPSLNVVAVWHNSGLSTSYNREELNKALRLLKESVIR